MSRLPPIDKLPLAVRKNVRDTWDSSKDGLATEISDILTVPWTIDINVNQVYPYALKGYGADEVGKILTAYMKGAAMRFKMFKDKYGTDGIEELNTLCPSHEITMDLDETNKADCCACAIVNGKLVIVFRETKWGFNVNNAFEEDRLLKALKEAPVPDGAGAKLNPLARIGISVDYTPKVETVRLKIAGMLDRSDVKLIPNFETVYEKLLEDSKAKNSALPGDWDRTLGAIMLQYWEGLVSQLGWKGFDKDDMLKEALNDEMESGEIAFRIVDKLTKGEYAEAQFEDGKLYLQTTPKRWRLNTNTAAAGLVDLL